MKLPLEGACACGAVHFYCRAEPLAMYNCHCRGCQRASGAAFVPQIVVPAQALTVKGPLMHFAHGDPEDQHAGRYVCSQCGSPVYSSSEEQPGLVLINALALNERRHFHPVADIWTVFAQPWVHWDWHIPKVYKAPPLLEVPVQRRTSP